MSATPAEASTIATRLRSHDRTARLTGGSFKALLIFTVIIALATLATLLVEVGVKGAPRLNPALFTHFPSGNPAKAGAQSAIVGTIVIMIVTAIVCIPVGVGAAIFLEEYRVDSHWLGRTFDRVVELNIANLAAVPSIVYGILGLGFLVRGLGMGQTVIAAALTLALLVLPTVVIASREAIRAVPDSLRMASSALGATRLQTVWRLVLPTAVPGVATGAILALSRAIGEAAPLILLGGLVFVTFNPTGLDSAFTVLPIQIFNWISRPQEEFKVLAAAAIIVLLMLNLLMNGVAIGVRNRYRKKLAGL